MKKRFYVEGVKTVWYEGEWIEAETEEYAKAFYDDARKQGLIEIREEDVEITADEEEEKKEEDEKTV